ncbi:MAG: hypothetical protein O3A85_12605 [Proteobacteria bacterium]|nr:hypothetical protein [Pseudomonadota bacterium]
MPGSGAILKFKDIPVGKKANVEINIKRHNFAPDIRFRRRLHVDDVNLGRTFELPKFLFEQGRDIYSDNEGVGSPYPRSSVVGNNSTMTVR